MKSRFPGIIFVTAVGCCAFGIGLLAGYRVDRIIHEYPYQKVALTARPSLEGDSPDVTNLPQEQTNAITPAFLSEARGALETFEEKARELDGQGALEQLNNRYLGYVLCPMLFALSSNEYPQAWSTVTGLRSLPLRRTLMEAVVAAWSRKDPRAALTAVLSRPESSDQRSWLGQIFRAWTEQDPQSAIAQVSQMPVGSRQNYVLQSVIVVTANRDPKAAAEMLKDLPNGMERDLAVDLVAQKLAMEGPDGAKAAAALLEQNPNGALRSASLQVVAAAMAARSIPETVAWARDLVNSKDQAVVLGTVASTLLETDKQQAIDLVMTQTDNKLRKEAVDVFVRNWASTDVQGAALWVVGLTDPSLRRSAVEALALFWSVRDPEAASTFALTMIHEGEVRTAALKSAASSWCQVQWSGDEASQFARQLPAGPERDAFLAGACESLKPLDPEQATQMASAMSPGKAQTAALQDSLGTWAIFDPESAADWGAALPRGASRSLALTTISENWVNLDPIACSQWLASLPADDARAKAAEAYVEKSTATRPDLAAQWVGSIADENHRNEQIEKIAQQWAKTDSSAAQAWLQQTSLPDERKRTWQGQ